jgi:serine/threonine protein kinase
VSASPGSSGPALNFCIDLVFKQLSQARRSLGDASPFCLDHIRSHIFSTHRFHLPDADTRSPTGLIVEDYRSDAVDSGNQRENTSRDNMYGCSIFYSCSEISMLSSTRSQNFFAEHDQAPPENPDSFRHFDFTPTEELPFKSLKILGHGGQADVDEVEYISLGRTCVRKRWRISETPHAQGRIRNRFFNEVAILKKLYGECHFITLLATYCQGTELGLLHLPLGQCDLNVLLCKPTQERRGLISDDDLERGFGCLSAALQYMHQKRIRHKDIKPGNILVHGASLVFIDFGISRDFSELSASLTGGLAEGTHPYYDPEVAARKPRGCSADVFSLGCVLLEIWSVLFGLAPEDQHSFPSLKPYYENLTEVQAWIEEKKSSENSPLRAFWLQACQLMVAKAPSKRPRMSNVLLRLREGYERQPSVFSTMCCRVCLEKHIVQLVEGKHDELRNTDFIWGSDVRTLLDQDHPTSLLPNSNQGRINGKSLVDLSLLSVL